MIEEYVVKIVRELFPDIKMEVPFKRFIYKEAMDKYKTDRPDIRENGEGFAFCWVTLTFHCLKRLVERFHQFTIRLQCLLVKQTKILYLNHMI